MLKLPLKPTNVQLLELSRDINSPVISRRGEIEISSSELEDRTAARSSCRADAIGMDRSGDGVGIGRDGGMPSAPNRCAWPGAVPSYRDASAAHVDGLPGCGLFR